MKVINTIISCVVLLATFASATPLIPVGGSGCVIVDGVNGCDHVGGGGGGGVKDSA